jgi:hypothetical protein
MIITFPPWPGIQPTTTVARQNRAASLGDAGEWEIIATRSTYWKVGDKVGVTNAEIIILDGQTLAIGRGQQFHTLPETDSDV